MAFTKLLMVGKLGNYSIIMVSGSRRLFLSMRSMVGDILISGKPNGGLPWYSVRKTVGGRGDKHWNFLPQSIQLILLTN